MLFVDLVGPFTKTLKNSTIALVLADHFTWWRDALAIKDGSTKSKPEALETKVFCYFGIPESIHSDKEAVFESQLMLEVCKIWGTDICRTTPYHSQGNGVVERGKKDFRKCTAVLPVRP